MSFKFDRDGSMIIKRNSYGILESSNLYKRYSRVGITEESFSPSSTYQHTQTLHPLRNPIRSKSRVDEKLVKRLEQRIVMLEQKLSLYEADNPNIETSGTFTLFPAMLSTETPDNINKGSLDRRKTHYDRRGSNTANTAARISYSKKEEARFTGIFNLIADFFTGTQRFFFEGGSIRVGRPEQNKAWIEYDKDVNILVIRLFSDGQRDGNSAKLKQDAHSKKKIGKASAEMRKKLKNELASVKRELRGEATALEKDKEIEEAQFMKTKAKKESELRKKMHVEAVEWRKKIAEKQAELKKKIEEEEKAQLHRRQKEEETKLKQKINHEARELKIKMEQREKELNQRIEKEEAELVRRNKKFKGASELIGKEMNTAIPKRRLEIRDTKMKLSRDRNDEANNGYLEGKNRSKDDNTEADARQTVQKRRNIGDIRKKRRYPSLQAREEKWQIFSFNSQREKGAQRESEESIFPQHYKGRGPFNFIPCRSADKKSPSEESKTTDSFFTKFRLPLWRSDGEKEVISTNVDGTSGNRGRKRLFSEIRLKRRCKSGKQSGVASSWFGGVRFRRRHSKTPAMEESHLSSLITERKQTDSKRNSLPGYWNCFFTGVLDGIGRIRLRSIRQITNDPATKKQRARTRSETKQRLKALSSRKTKETTKCFTLLLKEKKVPQYSSIRIRRVKSKK